MKQPEAMIHMIKKKIMKPQLVSRSKATNKDANKAFQMEDIQEVDQFKEVKIEQENLMSEIANLRREQK